MQSAARAVVAFVLLGTALVGCGLVDEFFGPARMGGPVPCPTVVLVDDHYECMQTPSPSP
jgi:hypothetical protein